MTADANTQCNFPFMTAVFHSIPIKIPILHVAKSMRVSQVILPKSATSHKTVYSTSKDTINPPEDQPTTLPKEE